MLLIEKKDSVLTLTLNRPESKNALTRELIKNIKDSIEQGNTDPSVRVIIIKGAGTVFCAGADLKTMQSMINFTFEQNKEDAQYLFEMFETIDLCPKPIITIIHGAAYGGALGFLGVSDCVLVEQKTQFCFSEVKLGIAPAIISHFLLKKFSRSTLQSYMTSGKVFSAETAFNLNLICDIFSNSETDVLKTWIDAYMDAGPEAVATTKKLVQKIPDLNEKESRDFAINTLADRRVSKEGQEGLKSFFEKRSPSWRKK